MSWSGLTYRDVFGLAVRLTGDEHDAADVAQEAYLRAYRSIRRFRGDAAFSTWMYRITANCAATAARPARPRPGTRRSTPSRPTPARV